jgi:GNAT superfamily N-acetyltransferase
MNIKINQAPIQSLDSFISLLEKVGEWLWNKGVKQWEPGQHHKNFENSLNLVQHGYLILAYQENTLIGGCILSEIVPELWADGKNALFLSSLVVARPAAGQGIGEEIIQYCMQVGLEDKKSFIRLDCWDGNDFLKTYYQKAGFVMLDADREKDYWVRLFEKRIQ